jgi:hypothetical protein
LHVQVLSLLHSVQTESRAHPASYPNVPGAIPRAAKRQGLVPGHSSPSTAQVKNTWSYTSSPPTRFNDVVLNYLSSGTSLLFSEDL